MTDLIIRAYARTKEQEAVIRGHGLPAKAIFLDGRGAETFDRCLSTFRGRPGRLLIAHDLRVFGSKRPLVAAVMARLERSRIAVIDLSNPYDTTISQMLARANRLIAGGRFPDRRRACRMGRRGGIGKGRAAAARRDGLADGWLVDNIVDDPDLTWAQRLRLLSPHFSEATLRRWYGAANAAKRAELVPA